MSVATRKFAASPKRNAAETWTAIMAAIAPNNDSVKSVLASVTGVAASVIAEGTPSSFPITVVGSGSRLRVYCLYDEDAVTAEEAHEDPLSWNIFESEWKIHFPADEVNFEPLKKILEGRGGQFVAYKIGEVIKGEESASSSPLPPLTINTERLRNNV